MKKLAIVLALVLVLAAAVTVITACDEKYDLVYANWNLGTDAEETVERQMVKAFEEANHVKIKVMNYPTGYDDAIKAAIARGDAPDVFMISNTNYVLNNQYGLDITQYAQADPDWNEIPAAVEEATHYKSGIYAVPFAMHMLGYFVNVDLLKQNNISLPSKISYEWFLDTISKVKKTANGETAIGLNTEATIYEWYPSAVNGNYGMLSWDGSEYHLNSPEFIEGMDQTKSIRSAGYTYDSLSEEARTDQFNGVEALTAWNQGKVAFRYGYSYEAPDMIKQNGGDFEIKFIGIPYVQNSENTNKRTDNFSILVPDYTSVYKGTANPELAFKFAKWMGYDPEGIAKRIELAAKSTDAAKRVPNTLPMTTDETAINKYFDIYPVEGVESMYDKLDEAVVEPTKIVPGYQGARWTASTGQSVKLADGTDIPNANMGQLLDACWNGDKEYRQFADSCNTTANKQYSNAVAKYANKYE